ncbi:MAG: protein kinase domain-containing protein [Bradymonadia bacterium]
MPLNKQLEGRLFDLLENQARVRLGLLVQLRRRSRARDITLLEAAVEVGHVDGPMAVDIARKAGITPPAGLQVEEQVGDSGTNTAEFDLPEITNDEHQRPTIVGPPPLMERPAPPQIPIRDEVGTQSVDLDDDRSGPIDLSEVVEGVMEMEDLSADVLLEEDDLLIEDEAIEDALEDEAEATLGGDDDDGDETLGMLDETPVMLGRDRAMVDTPASGIKPIDWDPTERDRTQRTNVEPATAPVDATQRMAGPEFGDLEQSLTGDDLAQTDRYTLGGELGRGAMGVVMEATDGQFDRTVAVKLLLEDDLAGDRVRFIDEARITAQLQHPNVPPVYEMGRFSDERLYFAMRRIEGRDLRAIIEDLREGDQSAQKSFGRVRLLTVFSQICRTMAYAHAQGVIHRDLKPENVMIGDFGEVTVMDWGLAKPFDAPEAHTDQPVRRRNTTDAGFSTQYGEMTGTPHYMPPEQARGELDAMGPRSDIYSLGAVLYELLTLEPPFNGRSIEELKAEVLTGELKPPSERAPDRGIPGEIERLCLQCLDREIEKRPENAGLLADAVETFLEGEQDQARKAQERRKLFEKGRGAADAWRRAMERRRQLQLKIARLKDRIAPWAPAEARRRLWSQEDELNRLQTEMVERFSEALAALHGALSIDGSHNLTRKALADLYYEAFEEAERHQHTDQMAQCAAMIRALDDDGGLIEALNGEGSLEIETRARGVKGTILRYEARDRVRVPTRPQRLNRLPVRMSSLPPGSYLVELTGPSLSPTRVPVLVERNARVRMRLKLFPDELVGSGFIHIAGGPTHLGGDEGAQLPLSERVEEIEDFFLARRPILAKEWLEFLRDLARTYGAEQAMIRAPRSAPGSPSLWPVDPEGLPMIPDIDAQGRPWHPDWPVVSISAEDAEAYCTWLSRRTGRPMRLPTETEWEKAARGADGRLFPWGDHFEPGFCHMGLSRPGVPEPGPVGTFEADVSPYGVADLAGGVSEWTSSRIGESEHIRVVKGGHWAGGPTECRSASRQIHPVQQRLPTLGFRLACDPPAG